MLHDTTILGEIYQLNRAYLTMLHRNLQEDFAAAVDAFGLSEEIARALVKNTPEKLDRLARSSQLLLRFKFNDVQFLHALGEKIGPGVARQIETKETLSA
ncbi:flagellar transcriptional activator FlhD [Paraburkholderia sp. GAS448]|uniref:flagellar transcriptional regulator FlhD n=1 Tax=Paraburkholderia sp. GAS448 TaxID=3035136 RepID=UPI003D1AE355